MRPDVGQCARQVVIRADFSAVFILMVSLEKKRKMLLDLQQLGSRKAGPLSVGRK